MKTYEAIETLMREHGDNPNSLAIKTHIPQPTIYRIVTGLTVEPKRANVEKIAKHYGVCCDALARGEIVKTNAPARVAANPEITTDDLIEELAKRLTKESPVELEFAVTKIKVLIDRAQQKGIQTGPQPKDKIAANAGR